MNSLFQQIQSRSSAPSLRPTATVVRDRRGRVLVERSELLSESQQKERVISSIEAGLKRKGVIQKRNPYQFPIESGVLHHYDDANSKTWKTGATAPPKEAEAYHDPSHPKCLNVITWNVWFAEHEWRNRLDGLVTVAIETERADVICMQEVTPRFLRQLMQYPIVQDQYHLVTSAAPNSWYGVAMLVKKWIQPPPKIEIVDQMKTKMGRTALIAVFGRDDDNDVVTSSSFSSSSLAIATVHLESLNSRATRSHQLQRIRQALAKYDNALLVGDYNITSTGPWADQEEDEEIISKNLGPDFIDWWNSVHPPKEEEEEAREETVEQTSESPETAGTSLQEAKSRLEKILLPKSSSSTFDTSANGMLKAKSRFAEEARYDRACLRLMSCGESDDHDASWQPGNIRIIGNAPIGADHKGAPIFISDHFGLAMEMNIRP